ncbi:DUF4097 family beta strand repeat-containing protein [Saccharomonospora halophila]|uniref:DUF4097 family beta strand repeat-containing protein n=1 Tax=Saccharomonospora halophila TaxID=129922 RepID=UPI00037A6488|nr:DUF4097 family beta strand repeat-containing protein [Saccharomonospora halophila]
MPNFDTPEPIAVELELGATGRVRLIATDRTDTEVDVRPSDASDTSDVRAAERVRVEYAGGTLRIRGPKARPFDFSRETRSVDVTVELPGESSFSGTVQLGNLHCAGSLGRTRFKSGTGDLHVERTGALQLTTATGHVTVDHATGDTEIHTGSGRVSIGRIDGTAIVKTSNGDVDVDAVTGDARIRSANGDIAVDRAGADVDVRTANGAIRLGEVARGAVALSTAMGSLELGVAEGTAAWVDAGTGFGQVHNLLESTPRPDDADEVVNVRARTSYGDITIRRC